MIGYCLILPLVGALALFDGRPRRGLESLACGAAQSANALQSRVPWLGRLLLASSAIFVGFNPHVRPVDDVPAHRVAKNISSACGRLAHAHMRDAIIIDAHVPYLGAWSPRHPADGIDSTFLHDVSSERHTAFLNQSNAVATAVKSLASRKDLAGNLPVFCATPDSGCTGSLTDDCDLLTDTRPCDEVFGQANGHVARCTAIGTLPVIAKNGKGQYVRFAFTNVRCVPGFKYTLLSVTQLWEEQHIDARFRDLNHLELPTPSGGMTIPYDPSLKLSSLVLVSDAKLKLRANKRNLVAVATLPLPMTRTHRLIVPSRS